MKTEPALELLAQTWEEVVDIGDLPSVCHALEKAGARLFGGKTEIALGDAPTHSGIPVCGAGTEEVLAYVSFRSSETPLDKLYLRLVSWCILHHRLRRASQQRQELIEGVRVARRILEESLPKSKLSHNGWEISGCLRPALHLGGDLYSFAAGKQNLRFLLADAVGHGLDSTLLVSECRALWRASAADDQGFCSEVSRVSALIYENTGAERYVAATFGRCYPDGVVELILCGQSPQFVLRHAGLECLGEPDLPLGVFRDQQFRVHRLSLQPGEALLLVSDGVLDLRNQSGETYGEGGVGRLQGHPCSQRILDDLFQDIDRFSQQAHDDQCALALVRKAP